MDVNGPDNGKIHGRHDGMLIKIGKVDLRGYTGSEQFQKRSPESKV